MKVRTNIKAGNLVQDTLQKVDDLYQEVNQMLNKSRVSVSRWGDVQGSNNNNI